MKLRYLFLVIALLTAGVLPSLALADEPQDVTELKTQCDQDDFEKCDFWGVQYSKTEGAKQSNTGALIYLKKACDLKFAKGCENYAVMKTKK